MLIIFFHVLKIGSLPLGLYVDETSIGYNAALIAETGKDEFGASYPTYFRAFGEFKNPIYIYLTAAIFKLSGVSEFGLRFTSFVFYLLALGFFVLFANKLWPAQRKIIVFATVAFGFLPQYFVLSRISFEVISQLSWLAASFYLIWLCFEGQLSAKQRWLVAGLCGLALGSSIYTYSTARVLSFLCCVSFGLIYLNKTNFKYLAFIGAVVLLCLIPYVLFSIEHPSAMTGRFYLLSYLDNAIPWYAKVFKFIRYYFEHWSPRFLIFQGDQNPRHASGYGGMVFVVVWALAIVGIGYLLKSGRWKQRFNLLLLVNMAFAPFAAALTEESVPHALRALPLGFYIVLMACFGLQALHGISDKNAGRGLQQLVWGLLLFEVAAYLFMYFVFFPERSIRGSQSYDTKASLQAAYDYNPKRILFYPEPGGSYANLKFYNLLVNKQKEIPLIITKNPRPQAGDCLIYYHWYEGRMQRFSDVKYQKTDRYQPNWLAKDFGVKGNELISRLRCY